jgi:microcystin-dependent protein
MPQHDFNIANQLFPPTRADINNALVALASNSSGTTAPVSPIAGQWWADTQNNVMKFRNSTNDAWIELFTLDEGTIVQPVTVETVPVGTIVSWPGLFAPEKWHLCDGSVLNRADYPGLFNVLGTRFNTGGETSAQFRLPDLRGRTIVGRDDMGGVAAGRVSQGVSGVNGLQLGATGGHQALQQHSHDVTIASGTISGVTDFAGNHTHSTSGALGGGNGIATVWTPGNSNNYMLQAGGFGSYFTDLAGQHQHNFTANLANVSATAQSSGAGNGQNMPPCMVLNYIIYTGGVGAEGDGGGGNIEPILSGLEAYMFACSDETTAISAPGEVIRIRMPYEFVPTGARIYVNSAATTGTFEVSATVNGNPMFSTNLTIDASERTSKTAAVPAVLAISNIADDAEIIVSVVNAADGTVRGLKMIIYGYRVVN